MYKCKAENAEQILDWIKNRGGILIWDSASLSNPEQTWTTPARTLNGVPFGPPNSQTKMQPCKIITDVSEVMVIVPKIVKKFHVRVRVGSQGMILKVTEGGTRQIYRMLAKYPDSWYEFDYSSYENCVIFIPAQSVLLTEFNGVV